MNCLIDWLWPPIKASNEEGMIGEWDIRKHGYEWRCPNCGYIKVVHNECECYCDYCDKGCS